MGKGETVGYGDTVGSVVGFGEVVGCTVKVGRCEGCSVGGHDGDGVGFSVGALNTFAPTANCSKTLTTPARKGQPPP